MELDEAHGCARSRTAGPFQIGGVIGVGAYGEVRYGKCTRTDREVSIKIIDASKFRDDSNVSIKQEVEILRSLSHKNIIQVVDFIEDISFSGTWCSCCGCTEYIPSGSRGHCANCGDHDASCHTQEETRQVVLIAQEAALGGEIFSLLKFNGALPEDIARFYFLELVRAVQYCHSKGIVHRDIKPENMILDQNFQLKLVDFGLASRSQDGNLVCGAVGSQRYSAPEVYYNKELYRNQGYRGEPADVWSSAVSLFIMLTGKSPFKRPLYKTFAPSLRKCTLFSALIDGMYPSTISVLAKDLLRKMFQLNPSHRLTFEEILKHPWCRSTTLPTDEQLSNQMSEFAHRSWKSQNKLWLSEILISHRNPATDAMDSSRLLKIDPLSPEVSCLSPCLSAEMEQKLSLENMDAEEPSPADLDHL